MYKRQAVNKSYFTDKRYYISQEEWVNLWRDGTCLLYTSDAADD
ncbi:hypothetical protein JMUB7520_27670 [Staphylococcus aureus]